MTERPRTGGVEEHRRHRHPREGRGGREARRAARRDGHDARPGGGRRPPCPARAGAAPPASGLKRAGPSGKGAAEEHTFLQLGGLNVRGVPVAGNHVPVEDLPTASSGKLRGAASGASRMGASSPPPSRAPSQSTSRWPRSWTAAPAVLAYGEAGAVWKLDHIRETPPTARTAHRRPDGVKRLRAELVKVRAIAHVLSGLSPLLS